MFSLWLDRLLSIATIAEGAKLADRHHAPFLVWGTGVLLFVIGIEYLCWSVERHTIRRLMPYEWRCPICRNKGHKFVAQSSLEAVTDEMRRDHNRAVHLME